MAPPHHQARCLAVLLLAAAVLGSRGDDGATAGGEAKRHPRNTVTWFVCSDTHLGIIDDNRTSFELNMGVVGHVHTWTDHDDD